MSRSIVGEDGMIHRAGSGRVVGLVLGLALLVLPGLSQAQEFEPGTPLAEAWAAFVEAQNAENRPLAVQRIDRVIPLVEDRYNRESANMALMLNWRANALRGVGGRLVEAEADAREALAISLRVSKPDSVQPMDATNTLAGVLLTDRGGGPEQRQLYAEEAVRLLQEAINRPAGSTPDGAAMRRTLRNTLINAYIVLGRPDEAIAVHALIVGDLTATAGLDDPMTQSATLNLAQAYIAAGRSQEAELTLQPLIDRLRQAGDLARPALANALSAYAGHCPNAYADGCNGSLERRMAARREAVAIYHGLGCRDPEGRRAAVIAAGGTAYPWSISDPDCPGDLRLARELATYGGLAYAERMASPPRDFSSLRLLANAGDLVIGNTRQRYARDQQGRADFDSYRFVHSQFVRVAWQANTSQ